MKKTGKVVNLEVVVNNKEENIMNENEQVNVTEIAMPNEAEITDTTKNEDGEFDVAELVKTGPCGVTNQGMIPHSRNTLQKVKLIRSQPSANVFLRLYRVP